MVDEEFKILVKAMRAVYTQATFIPDQYAYRVWFKLLNDLDYKDCQRAVQEHMTTCKFPPTIADIRTLVASYHVEREEGLGELEAWALVRRAVGNSIYASVAEFEKLPELVKKAVGSPENLCEWGKTEISETQTVIQSHFLRSFRIARERDIQQKKLQPHMRVALDVARTPYIDKDDINNNKHITEKCPPPFDLNQMMEMAMAKRERRDGEKLQ